MSRSRARGLGAELREIRKASGLRMVDLGTKVGISKSTIARIETGEKVPDITDLAVIIGALGVTGSRRESLLEMAQEALKPNWFASIEGLPEQLTTLIDYESTAVRITEVGLQLVPGLLQTPDYARAVLHATGVQPGEIDTRVTIRQGRQSVLTREAPVDLLAIIDEPVLRRPIGGRAVAAGQLRRLLQMAGRPNVTLQVIPYSRGAHVAIDGPYVLIEFAKEEPVVHLEHRRSGAFLDDAADVNAYRDLTDTLRQEILSPADSAGLVRDCIAEMEST